MADTTVLPRTHAHTHIDRYRYIDMYGAVDVGVGVDIGISMVVDTYSCIPL